MMVKDYTDYLVTILDSGERVYHIIHLRNAKGCKINGNPYPFKQHDYLLNLDRAYRIRWAPWKKIDKNKPWWPFWSIREFIRGKKIGLLLYQEPCKKDCALCKKNEDKRYLELYPNCYGLIEPMHISRIHQPSGEMKG